jgi:hypothetical protein
VICFRDKTFCGSDCVNATCHRHFGPADKAAAVAWWGGGEDAPIAYADFSSTCADYQRPTPPPKGPEQ